MVENLQVLTSKVELLFIQRRKSVRKTIEGLLTELYRQCIQEDASVVGHLKCFVEDEMGKFLYGSITSLIEGPHTEGNLKVASRRRVEVVFNIIVFGVEDATLINLFRNVIKKFSEKTGINFQILSIECHEQELY